MGPTKAEASTAPHVLFGRPKKKSKVYRQRADALDTDSPNGSSSGGSGSHPPLTADRQPTSGLVVSGTGKTMAEIQTEIGRHNSDDDRDRRRRDDIDSHDDDYDDEYDKADDTSEIRVAELIRQRKGRRPKLGGIGFRGGDAISKSTNLSLPTVSDRSLVPLPALPMAMDFDLDVDGEEGSDEPIPIGMRFAPQTGIIGEAVNKHMEEYVEAMMAKRYREAVPAHARLQRQSAAFRSGDKAKNRSAAEVMTAAEPAKPEEPEEPAEPAEPTEPTEPTEQTEQTEPTEPATMVDDRSRRLAATTSTTSREQLAKQGKLHEVDLGTEARARNIARTAQATRGLRSRDGVDEESANDDDDDAASRDARNAAATATMIAGGKGVGQRRKGQKPQSKRARRGSDDLKRDQLVEDFLRENRLDVDVYDVAPEPPAGSSTEGRPTDDKIAEQFRREFMESMAQRLRRKRRPLGPPAKSKTRNEEEILRGPKLGGSRNVRSVMRDKLLQKQEEERQNMPKYEQELQEQKRRANRRR